MTQLKDNNLERFTFCFHLQVLLGLAFREVKIACDFIADQSVKNL